MSFFTIACEATVGRLHHGCTPSIKFCAYPTAFEQLGILASVSRSLSAVIPATFSTCVFVFLRHKATTTWLSLVSMPSISKLDAFTQSFKHFKDGFFKVVVKEGGRPYFFNADGNIKFPFSWTDNPWRYKDMKPDELSVTDKEVVELLMKFTDRLPTKDLVRVYNSIHSIIDIEGIFL